VVPVIDLARRAERHRAQYHEAVDRVLTSGQVLLGPELAAFEREFAAYTGAAHCVAVSAGAAAIQLALVALGVRPGDEVLVPAFTAVPTASAVCAIGAVPVPVDVDEHTGALDQATAIAAIGPLTRAVIPVHLYGRPAPLPHELDLAIVEDAAQAHGALRRDGGHDGAHRHPSAATIYSFYPTKNLGGIGDGGAVVTDDDEMAALLRRLRVHGMSAQYVHTEVSQNFRMSELEASWLSLMLADLDAGNARRRTIASAYRDAAPELRWHADHPDHVYHLAVARVHGRDEFRGALAERDIATAVHYPLAITQQPAYKHLTRLPCPRAEAWAEECVSLPCFPELTDGEVSQVCDALAAVSAVHRPSSRS